MHKTLTNKQEIKIKGSMPHFDIRIGCDKNEAWSSRAASCLHNGPMAEKIAAAEKRKIAFDAAPMIEDKELVMIEGTLYKAYVNGPNYADPVTFIKVEA